MNINDKLLAKDWDKNNLEESEKQDIRLRNNPNKEPVGHFTGRCKRCHSKDLWDDNSAYGCSCCKAIYFTG